MLNSAVFLEAKSPWSVRLLQVCAPKWLNTGVGVHLTEASVSAKQVSTELFIIEWKENLGTQLVS